MAVHKALATELSNPTVIPAKAGIIFFRDFNKKFPLSRE
jgi:hypothetical protein